MIGGINWNAVVAIIGLAVTLGGFILWLLRARFSGDFASKGDVAELGQRMDDIEARLRRMPTHEDVQGLGARLAAIEARAGAMESGLAAIGERVSGVRDGVARVERDLGLFLQAAIAEKGKPTL
jgi:hypothetical protein